MRNLFKKIKQIKQRKLVEEMYPDLEKSVIDLFLENYGYTMPISLLARLDAITKKLKPQLIFEFGTGVSTILLSSNLRNTGGKIFTFDESLKWIWNTYRKCSNPDNIAYIYLPSQEKINYQIFTENININRKIDLLIIDGPSGDRFKESAQKLYDKLISPETICVIDDTDRGVNNAAAEKLATFHKLRKVDYKDPLFTKHKYSILYPQSIYKILCQKKI